MAGKDHELLKILQGMFEKREDVLNKCEGVFFRIVKSGVKHVLSHRVILANFYELCLSEDFRPLPGFIQVAEEDLHKFAVPNLVYQFFSLILKPNNQNKDKDVSK